MNQTQFVNPMPKFQPPMMFKKQKYMFTRYSAREIERIIEWCKKEYWDSISYWSARGHFKNVKLELDEFSAVRLMATLSIFDELIMFFKYFPFVWEGLSKKSRDFLAYSYEFRSIMQR